MVFSKQGYQKKSFSVQAFEKWNSLQKGLQETSEVLNVVRKEAKGSVQTHFISLKEKKPQKPKTDKVILNV